MSYRVRCHWWHLMAFAFQLSSVGVVSILLHPYKIQIVRTTWIPHSIGKP